MTMFNQVITRVNNSQIRKITDAAGDEIIIVPSYTMPDDVVMNGILYPAGEIEKSFHTLDGTPAPIGHPVDDNGNFVSASSELGINRYHAGVFNKNPARVGNRVYLEKHVNTRIAASMNRGPELLETLELAMSGEPVEIHTSIGVYLDPIAANDADEYDGIATNMIFDHDAILIDEIGAATPQQGVGMLVNKQGKALVVNRAFYSNDVKPVATPQTNQPKKAKNMDEYIKLLRANGVEVSDDATEPEVLALLATNLNKPTEVDHSEVITNAVAEALKPMQEQVAALTANAEAAENAEREQLTKVVLVANTALTEDDLKTLPLSTLRKMGNTHVADQLPAGEFRPNSAVAFNATEYLKTISGVEV